MPEIVQADATQRATRDASLGFFAAERDALRAMLRTHGALLLRGFHVRSPEAVDAGFDALLRPGEERVDYRGGISPRERVGPRVYSASEAPRFVRIPMHAEMSYLPAAPALVAFHCAVPPTRGGATPLADGRRVLADMPDDIAETLEHHALLYTRRLPAESPTWRLLGRLVPALRASPWPHAYEGASREAIDAHCASLGQETRWLPDGALETRARVKGISEHPETGERAWFNTLHSNDDPRRMFGPALGTLISGARRRLGATLDITLADGIPLPADTGARAAAVVDAHTTRFAWQAGDLLLLDNRLCMHGRDPFRGRRSILVGLAA